MTDEAAPSGAKDQAAIGYVDALAELEEILDELEDDNVDIDVLSARVERAATLIKVCRGRINDAQAKVAAIVADFDTPTDDAAMADE